MKKKISKIIIIFTIFSVIIIGMNFAISAYTINCYHPSPVSVSGYCYASSNYNYGASTSSSAAVYMSASFNGTDIDGGYHSAGTKEIGSATYISAEVWFGKPAFDGFGYHHAACNYCLAYVTFDTSRTY